MILNSALYICSTYHHVFVTLSKCLIEKQDADIILCDDIPKHIELQNTLCRSKIFRHVYLFSNSRCPGYNPKELLKRCFGRHAHHRKIIERELKIDFTRYNQIYIFHDGTKLGRYLMDTYTKYNLIEDGLDFFKIIDTTPSSFMLEKFSGFKFYMKKLLNIGYIFCGQNRFCQSIEVNDLKGVKIPTKKVHVLSKKRLYQTLLPSQKNIIYRIFVSSDTEFDKPGKKILILTIPLFVDKYVKTEENQKEIYSNLVNEHGRGGNLVYLKPHPRDKTDYSKLKNVVILDRFVPTEAYNFNPNLFFEKAIAIHSSSVDVIENVRKKEKLPISYLNRYRNYLHNWVINIIDGGSANE